MFTLIYMMCTSACAFHPVMQFPNKASCEQAKIELAIPHKPKDYTSQFLCTQRI
jgi:hypothetical protein